MRELADDDLNQAAGGSVMQQSTGKENLNPGGVPDASKQDHSGDELLA